MPFSSVQFIAPAHQPGPEDAAAAKKSRKAKGKEAKLRRKAKEELQSFRSLMGMAGICILGRARRVLALKNGC